MFRAAILTLGLCLPAFAAEPVTSGPQPGQRPGPYSFVISTGPQRGQSFCFICDTGDKPAVVVFTKTLSDPLGKLVARLDRAVPDNKAVDLRGWITLLDKDQPRMDPQLVQWGKKHAIRSMPLGIFEDDKGPPSYRLSGDADVTVLLFVKRKVVANFAFRPGELDDKSAGLVLEALPRILASDKEQKAEK